MWRRLGQSGARRCALSHVARAHQYHLKPPGGSARARNNATITVRYRACCRRGTRRGTRHGGGTMWLGRPLTASALSRRKDPPLAAFDVEQKREHPPAVSSCDVMAPNTTLRGRERCRFPRPQLGLCGAEASKKTPFYWATTGLGRLWFESERVAFDVRLFARSPALRRCRVTHAEPCSLAGTQGPAPARQGAFLDDTATTSAPRRHDRDAAAHPPCDQHPPNGAARRCPALLPALLATHRHSAARGLSLGSSTGEQRTVHSRSCYGGGSRRTQLAADVARGGGACGPGQAQKRSLTVSRVGAKARANRAQ